MVTMIKWMVVISLFTGAMLVYLHGQNSGYLVNPPSLRDYPTQQYPQNMSFPNNQVSLRSSSQHAPLEIQSQSSVAQRVPNPPFPLLKSFETQGNFPSLEFPPNFNTVQPVNRHRVETSLRNKVAKTLPSETLQTHMVKQPLTSTLPTASGIISNENFAKPPSIEESEIGIPRAPVVEASGDKNSDVKWCIDAKKKFSVNPGKSWGSLRGKERAEWASRGCDTVVATGRSFSCDDNWGSFKYFTSWKLKEEVRCQGESQITCRTHTASSSTACIHENIVIDFSKAIPSSNARSFSNGFLKASCQETKVGNVLPLPPGALLTNEPLASCDVIEDKPSFFMSHDLIFNLGHTISDFWIVWTTMRAMEQDFEEFQLVNMDAIRGNGPAGRGSKLTYAGHPDHISPFFAQYEQWFKHGIVKGIDYGKKKVCFKKAVFQAKPGPAHIWTSLEFGKGSTTEKCSLTPGYRSSLLKEYNVFNRLKWGLIPSGDSSGGTSLANQAAKRITYAGQVLSSLHEVKQRKPSITLVVRKGDNMRVYMNEQEVVDALKDIPGAGVVKTIDFSAIPFREQIELVHNTSLLIGMHGAALFHLLSMDVDSAVGCGVVELYHKRWSQSEAVPTVSNMARFLGVDYYKLRSKETESVAEIRQRGRGTLVDAVELREIVTSAIAKMNQRAEAL